jgi:uncharacterized membrane protein YccC
MYRVSTTGYAPRLHRTLPKQGNLAQEFRFAVKKVCETMSQPPARTASAMAQKARALDALEADFDTPGAQQNLVNRVSALVASSIKICGPESDEVVTVAEMGD